MKGIFENLLALCLGLLIVGVIGLIATMLFGGAALSVLGFVIGFPLAFPFTTATLVVIALLFLLRQKFPGKKR